ncbi:phosphate ABC transporter substrate-binding protein PstS [Antribacter gilvus]|uniref:phosphate ABC transporter substrate-binding protein PstS n=1 Tax=Antribacter gilvus TaxID=2304675 RepID=UPI0030B80ABD
MKLSRFTRAGSAVTVGVLALTLAACNPDAAEPGTETSESAAAELTGEFAGAGASSQESAMAAWTATFGAQHPDVTINYAADGSGAGREAITAGTVAWAGSDRALKDEEITETAEYCGPDGAWSLPVYVSPIAVAFNLPGVETLNLTPDTVAKIFAGTIKTWNDPAIAADNPDATLPTTAVVPVHRSDDSGTTENFTDYLAATAPDVWTWEPDGVFPEDIGGESAGQSSGVIGVVESTEGAVTYVDASKVGAGIGTAAIKVGEEFVAYTPEAAAAAVDASPLAEGRHEHDLSYEIDRTTTASGAYPIVLVSYALVCSNYSDEATGTFVKEFVGYIASAEGQEVSASEAGSAPISSDLQGKVAAALEAITVG